MKNVKLYNIIFPIWFFYLIPYAWILIIPMNFLIDSLVTICSCKYLKIANYFEIWKKTIFKTVVFGFLSDLIGVLFLFLICVTDIFKIFSGEIISALNFNPFRSLIAFLIIFVAIFISGFFIYFLNKNYNFSKLDIEERQKKKMALYMAIFTAPYTFLIPIELFYR